jgi:hypothetical protein
MLGHVLLQAQEGSLPGSAFSDTADASNSVVQPSNATPATISKLGSRLGQSHTPTSAQPTLTPSLAFSKRRTWEDNEMLSCSVAYPQPKWPAGHESEAFEAVAIKKSSILSPPEIYAEIAHHGRPAGSVQLSLALTLTSS